LHSGARGAIQSASFGGFSGHFRPKDPVASRFVDLSMLSESRLAAIDTRQG
jgi:hypothetical protein